jgi:NAD(P)-dependent dehydrogenase (short-subunit alcohol dehydrogenase family)
MPSVFGALIVFGSGPGVGHGVAKLFAERGFSKVIILSRAAGRLAKEADLIRSVGGAGIEVKAIPLDLSNPDNVSGAVKIVEESLGATLLECVLYNAARTGSSHFFEFSSQNLEKDIKVNEPPALVDSHNPTLFLTPAGTDRSHQPIRRSPVGDSAHARRIKNTGSQSCTAGNQRQTSDTACSGDVLACRLQGGPTKSRAFSIQGVRGQRRALRHHHHWGDRGG